MHRPVVVGFSVPVTTVFDFLVEPRNRPAWQSSLRRVEDVDGGAPHVGQRWVDVTAPGLRPRMRTVELDRPSRWTEHGSWRGLEVVGELRFVERPGGCEVTALARFSGGRRWRAAVPLLERAAARAVAADLARAAVLLERDR